MIRTAGVPTVLLAGGGTGGHLYPGIAVAETLQRRAPAARTVLAATDRDRDSHHGARCPLETIELRSPQRPGNPLAFPAFAARMSGALARSFAVLRDLRPHVVVGLGGYGSVAPVVAARLSGIPAVLLEQNAVPGIATKLLARFGAVTAASFEGTERHVRGAVVLTGNPLRRGAMTSRAAHADFGLAPGLPVLGVLGGSLGAHGVNRRVADAVPALVAATGGLALRFAHFQVIHATGSDEDAALLREAYAAAGVRACVRPFFEDMGAVYGTCDAVLCRAGGTTVAELAVVGLPAVFVPYPHHRDQHQRENARALVERGAAALLREEDATPQAIAAEVAPLLVDLALRARRARETRRLGRPDAADRVVDLLLQLSGTAFPADFGRETAPARRGRVPAGDGLREVRPAKEVRT